VRDSVARPRALPGDHGKAAAAEQLVDGVVLQIGSACSDGERGGHGHPTSGWIAVRQVFYDLQRRDGVELAAAERAWHPHRQNPLSQKRVNHRLRQLPQPISPVGVLVGKDGNGLCASR